MTKTEKFKFWCPLDISKAKNEQGDDVMRLGGIASTMDKDADGEFLDPSGFDITDFKKSGVVNWHHQAKNSPATIIGEPHKAEVRTDGFYVETDLYPSSELAQEVYALAQTLAKDSKSRRLGYSIEGTVIERDDLNPKIVKQAKITGLAITHMPKNAQTFADIIKGHGHIEDEDEDKSLDTSSGSAVMPESVEGDGKDRKRKDGDSLKYVVKSLSSELMYDKIFDTFPGISIEKAEKVFEFLNKIEVAMAKGKTIENQDLEKAMAHLGLDNLDENPFLEKASKGDAGVNGGDTKTLEKDKSEMSDQEVADAVERETYGNSDESEENESEEENEDEGSESEEKEEKEMKKGIDTAQILKAIQSSNDENVANVRALAQLVKAQMDTTEIMKGTLNRTRKELAETKGELIKALDTIEELGGQSTGRKSITKGYVDRKFEGEDNLEKGHGAGSAALNQTTHRKQIVNILDNAAFAKGFDEEFSKAVTSFEAGTPLTPNVIARLKNEYGVNIQQ